MWRRAPRIHHGSIRSASNRAALRVEPALVEAPILAHAFIRRDEHPRHQHDSRRVDIACREKNLGCLPVAFGRRGIKRTCALRGFLRFARVPQPQVDRRE